MKVTQEDVSAMKWAIIVIGASSGIVVHRDVFGSLVDLFQGLAQEVAKSGEVKSGTEPAK